MGSYRRLRMDQFLTADQREILKKSALCQKLNDDQSAYFFEVVERTRLDPFIGQIRPDVRSSKNAEGVREPTLLIITTLQGLRTIGERTGQHDGEAPWEWCDGEGNWHEVWLSQEPPVAARASVFRKDRPRPQTQVVLWTAMVQLVYDKKGDAVPNPFWRRMGPHMLGKCAQAGAYRGAYPDQCSRLYITEEIAETLDPDSEEAIEAEMIRRARGDKQYWDAERTKGHLPIDEQQRLEKQQALQHPPPGAGPRRIDVPELSVVNSASSEDPEGAWKKFVIRRIQLFAGRTVGSLTSAEIRGFKSWLERAKASWVQLDDDLRAHHDALKARYDQDTLDEFNASFERDFTLASEPETK